MAGGSLHRTPRTLLFSATEVAAPLIETLVARGHRVEIRDLGASFEPDFPAGIGIVVVDVAGAREVGLDLLARLRTACAYRDSVRIALATVEQLAAAAEAGADYVIEPEAPAQVVTAQLALAERRLDENLERRAADDVLRASHANLTALIENTNDFILFSDRSGKPLFFNSAYATVMKQLLDLDMRPGIKPHELLPDPAAREVWNRYHDRVLGGERFVTVYSHRMPDGAERHFEVSYNPVRKDGEIIGFSEFTREVTERVNAARSLEQAHHDLERKVAERTEELRASEERLRHAEKLEAIGRLAGGIAHDFNNQLLGIMGYADLIEMNAADEQLRGYAASIHRATERSADLVSQLLAFARRGKQQSAPVDLHRILDDVVELLERSIDKRIAIERRFEAPRAVTIGDQALLHSALLNLGLNGRDAMPEGGSLVFATEVVELTDRDCAKHGDVAPGRYVAVTVTDTGAGMDADTRQRVFEPFFTTKDDGNGMGLAAVYGAVRSHHGMIHVDSEPGRGTRFELHLPLSDAPVLDDAVSHNAPRPEGRAHILVVDDEPMVRDLLATVLAELGYEVATCEDGDRALSHYREHWQAIDLVIFDMVMPRLDGAALFREMRKINPSVKALLSSGYSVRGRAEELLAAGSVGLLQKPYGVDDVAEQVRRALAS